MARDLDRAIDLILTDLNRGTEHSARVREAICDAIALYTPRRFGFNETVASLSWSQSVYQAMPTAWVEIDYLRLNATSYRLPLEYRTPDWMNDQERDANTVTAPPRYWSNEARTLRLYPKPDQDYGVTVAYQLELTEVSISALGTASNAWLNEGWPLIKAEASIDLIENFLGGDEMGRLPGLRARREEWIRTNEARANREQGGGSLEPWL